MSKGKRVDEMKTPPIVGQYYMVATVRHKLFDLAPRSWAVMGVRHSDAEHLNFPYQHYHLDWRFVPQGAWRKATNNRYGEQGVFGIPLHHVGMEHGPVIYRRRKCLRDVPVNVIFATMPGGIDLHRAWHGKPAVQGQHGLICPHRGTHLGSVPANRDGTVTCPLHGLKFCARTGASVATRDMQVTP
ncbi:MAG: Rieske 2Fe-2S domain-containing protein [Rhizomicrobium sp.]